jgi:glutaminase
MNSELQDLLNATFDQCQSLTGGKLADYIPELALANAEEFGIALATVSGEILSVGDATRPFTIQSISKALMYALALDLLGSEVVHGTVGVEPSGDAFNSIELDPSRLRPYNPMVNSGAIAIASLIYRAKGPDAFEYVLDRFSAAAGRTLSLDDKVYRSESDSGHRNRAMAYLMLNFGLLERDVEAVVDLYFRQCSIRVSAIDLAWMGATLANLGEHPRSGEVVFDVGHLRDLLSVMFTCGMYDFAGNWAHRVGIPAKSGVGGGILGVVNRQLGIGTYSPRLDERGNSVRGIAVFEALNADLGLHVFESANVGSSFLGMLLRT